MMEMTDTKATTKRSIWRVSDLIDMKKMFPGVFEEDEEVSYELQRGMKDLIMGWCVLIPKGRVKEQMGKILQIQREKYA